MDRPEIRLLESRVIDQIAAGEVIERPASVVKELVENALDAGATRVVVVLEDGGRSRIRVEDDGHGMSESESLLAIERHATSKIRRVDDLESVRTLGFRGEAIPSIASVSRFELVTRPRDADAGTRVRIDAGTLRDVRPAGASPGTTVDVRDLFHTLPARRSFLRSAPTEAGHALEVVRRVAFVRPDVGFEVRTSERIALRAPPAADLRARASALLGPDGADLVPFEIEGPAGRLWGWWAPGVHRGSVADGVHAYVRGRWVRDRVLRNAVAAALAGRVPPGRSPLVLIDLAPPSGGVDVNVHPAKAEVRFRDPGGVAAFVTDALSAVSGRARALAPREPLVLVAPEPPPSPAIEPPPSLAIEPPPEPVAAPPVAAEPAPSTRRLVGVVRARFVVVDEGDGLAVFDGGRWMRRGQARQAAPGPRMVVPARVALPGRDVVVVQAAAEAFERLGLRVAVLSPTEVVVRGLPASLQDAPPAELIALAIAALRRGADPRAAWGDGLPPAPISAALVDVAALTDDLRVGRVPWP